MEPALLCLAFLFFHEDHRGTPESPGRVATLLHRDYWEAEINSRHADAHANPPDRVWGVAYHIPSEYVEEVKAYLDIREVNGYTIDHIPFYPHPHSREEAKLADANEAEGSDSLQTLVYIGTPENPQFVGPEDPKHVADIIAHSVGPSGPNVEYLRNLQTALKQLGEHATDDHIDDLVSMVS